MDELEDESSETAWQLSSAENSSASSLLAQAILALLFALAGGEVFQVVLFSDSVSTFRSDATTSQSQVGGARSVSASGE